MCVLHAWVLILSGCLTTSWRSLHDKVARYVKHLNRHIGTDEAPYPCTMCIMSDTAATPPPPPATKKVCENVQSKKECQAQLAHLRTHRDTSRRLQAVVQREGQLQEQLKEKQRAINDEMTACAQLLHCSAAALVCSCTILLCSTHQEKVPK